MVRPSAARTTNSTAPTSAVSRSLPWVPPSPRRGGSGGRSVDLALASIVSGSTQPPWEAAGSWLRSLGIGWQTPAPVNGPPIRRGYHGADVDDRSAHRPDRRRAAAARPLARARAHRGEQG